jgi:hypothetical protein
MTSPETNDHQATVQALGFVPSVTGIVRLYQMIGRLVHAEIERDIRDQQARDAAPAAPEQED